MMRQGRANNKQINGAANQFSSIASLIGEPARATMLWKMLEGKAFTATELAVAADVSAQSASMHLSKLVNAKLLTVVTQGRHKYYRLANADVAYVLESISNLVPHDKLVTEESADISQHDIKYCRTCYDHLAGRVGVELTERLEKKKIIVSADQNFDVTSTGAKWFAALEISVDDLRKQRRVFAKKCLDWSERRYHLSGSLGASLLKKMIEMKWLRKVKESRRITLTAVGQEKMNKLLGLNL